LILDTDILIWSARGNRCAIALMEETIPFSISSITMMELLQGAKNRKDQNTIIRQFASWDIEIIDVSESISALAVQYIKEFSLSKGLSITDALIAATVTERSEELLTGNEKHFQFIPGLKIKTFRP